MAEQTFTFPVSSYGEPSTIHAQWNLSAGSYLPVDSELTDGNTRFAARIEVIRLSASSHQVRLSFVAAQTDTNPAAANQDLSSMFETSGSLTLAITGATFDLQMNGVDTAEPYTITSSSSEVATFWTTARATNLALTLTVRDFVPTAPSWTDDTGDAISGRVGIAIADVVVPAVDAGSPAPTYAAVGSLPAGVTFDADSRTLSFDENAIVAGSGTITIRATNASGSDDWTVDYTFAAAFAVPVFADDTGTPISGTEGTAITPVTVPAASGNPTPTYAVVGSLPGGLDFDTATRELSGTPAAAGSGTIRVRATNSQGSDDWTVDYTFVAAVSAPLFADDTGDAIAGNVGRAIADVTVPEASGMPAPSYAAVGALPTGVSFDTGTRVLSFDENAIEVGSGTIRIRATNSEGTDDWTVDYTFGGALVERSLFDGPAHDPGDDGDIGVRWRELFTAFPTTPNATRAHLIANNEMAGGVTPDTFEDQGENVKRIDWFVLHHGRDVVILNLNSSITNASEVDFRVAFREQGTTNVWDYAVSSDANDADPYELPATQADLTAIVAVITGGGTLDAIIYDVDVANDLPNWDGAALTYTTEAAALPLPVAARFEGVAGTGAVALEARVPGVESVGARMDGVAGSGSVSIGVQDVAAAEAVGARFTGTGGNLAAAIGVRDVDDAEPVGAPFAGVGGTLRPVAIAVRDVAADQPVAARLAGEGGMLTAAVDVRDTAGAQPVAARLAGAPGALATAIDIRDVAAAEPIAARLTGVGGALSAALEVSDIGPAQPVAARLVGAGGMLTAALGIRTAGVEPVAARLVGVGGMVSAALGVREADEGTGRLVNFRFSATGTIHMLIRVTVGEYTRGNGQVNLWASDLWTDDGAAGQVGTLEEGDPHIAGIENNSPIVRRFARWDRGGTDQRLIINSQDDNLGVLFDALDDPYRLTMVRTTDTPRGYQLVTHPPPSTGDGASFIDWRRSASNYTNDMWDALNDIDAGDEIILAIHQGVASYTPARQALAARGEGVGGRVSAAVGIRAIDDAEPVSARFAGAGGALSAGLAVRAVDDAEPVGVRFPGVAGVLSADIDVRGLDTQSVSVRFASVPGALSAALDVRDVGGAQPVGARFAGIAGALSAALGVRAVADAQSIAVRFTGLAGMLSAGLGVRAALPPLPVAVRFAGVPGTSDAALDLFTTVAQEHVVSGVWRSFSGGFALGATNDNFTPASGRELPSEWIAGGVGFVRALWLQDDGDDISITFQIAAQDSGLGSGSGPQILNAIEADLRLTLHAPDRTYQTDLSQDTTEPYVWTPSPNNALRTFFNSLSNNDPGSLEFTLGDFEIAAEPSRGVAGVFRPPAITIRDVDDAEQVGARFAGISGSMRAQVAIRDVADAEQVAARFIGAGGRGGAALNLAMGILPIEPERFAGVGGAFRPVAITIVPVGADQPVAARFIGAGGRLFADIDVRSAGTQPVGARIFGLSGTFSAALELRDVGDAQPVGARFAGIAGALARTAVTIFIPFSPEPIPAGSVRFVGVPGILRPVPVNISVLSVPSKIVGFETIPGDGYIELSFEPLDARGYPLVYEYQIEDGSWVEFVPS